MADLLRHLESRYDVILLDAPPLLPVTDAAVLATATSGAVLIARHGSTKRDQLARAAESLTDGVGARILGCVINMTPKRGRDAYYYGYAYSYQRRGSRRSPHTTGQTAEVLPKMPTLADDALHAAPVIRPTRSPVDELDPIITERPPREASGEHNHEASPPANGDAVSRPLRVGRPPNHD
jgi:Mrp family chromosome partitioning ATPase